MSATNRDTLRPADDYYATPAWAIDQLLAHLPLGTGHPDAWMLDPGCGDGAIMERVVMSAGVGQSSIVGVESDPARAALARERFPEAAVLTEDYLSDTFDGYLSRLGDGPIVIIGNPPYSRAIDFALRSIAIAKTRARSVVCFLLRLAFMETVKRAAFHRDNPSHVYVLPRRPSFCHSFKCKACDVKLSKACAVSRLACPECGKNMGKTTSDATAYGWFVWGDGSPGRWEVL